MMHKLTPQQKESIEGEKFDGVQFFNPVQDINGDWFISAEEINQCTNELFHWVKDLEPSEYVPVIIPEN